MPDWLLHPTLTHGIPASKTVKKHFLQAHERAAGSRVKTRHPHILREIPLSYMAGFDRITKSYFIPRFQNTLDHPAGGESPDGTASDANLATFQEQELMIRRAQTQAPSAVNINKEEDFFNRSTRYYKYLQGKNITTLLATVRPRALDDPVLLQIHELTMEAGMDAIGLVLTLSVGTRELVNTFYTNAMEMRRIQPFQELNPRPGTGETPTPTPHLDTKWGHTRPSNRGYEPILTQSGKDAGGAQPRNLSA